MRHKSSKRNKGGFTKSQCSKGGQASSGTTVDARQSALIDAKGMVLREGMFYSSNHPDGQDWCKRRALVGRVDQVELVYAGDIRKTTGETLLRNDLRWMAGV